MFLLFLCQTECVFTSSTNTPNFSGIKIHPALAVSLPRTNSLWEQNTNSHLNVTATAMFAPVVILRWYPQWIVIIIIIILVGHLGGGVKKSAKESEAES